MRRMKLPILGPMGSQTNCIFTIIMKRKEPVSEPVSKEVQEVQKAIAEKGATWVAGETSMTRLTPEQRRKRLGLKK
jgi:hypothetical protein